MRGHATVFVKRDGIVVGEAEADCRIEFDYAFNFVIDGEVWLCFSSSLRPERRSTRSLA